jgi:hypothetical protein
MNFTHYLEIVTNKRMNQDYYIESLTKISPDLKIKINEAIAKNSSIKEVKERHFNEFSKLEKEVIYEVTTETYKQSTGASWNEDSFYSKASGWTFFGNIYGYVAVRIQGSKNYKLVSMAQVGLSGAQAVLKAIELLKQKNNVIWGVVTETVALIAQKIGMLIPPGWLIKLIFSLRMIPATVFGGAEIDIKNIKDDGGIPISYHGSNFNRIDQSDVNVNALKYYIANEEYYLWLNRQLESRYNLKIDDSMFLKIIKNEASKLEISIAFKDIIKEMMNNPTFKHIKVGSIFKKALGDVYEETIESIKSIKKITSSAVNKIKSIF